MPFKKMNLLYGENGVGKTSLLGAIELGITGRNQKTSEKRSDGVRIDVNCMNTNGKCVSLHSYENNAELSEVWYGIKAENSKNFNRLFNRFNYFDTSWASAFAIEGIEQVNLIQLQNFLGIDKIENGEKALLRLYKIMIQFAKENLRLLKKASKQTYLERNSLFCYFGNMKKDHSYNDELNMTEKILEDCQKELKKLEEEIDVISLEDILNAHIKRIESIFKLLVFSGEFRGLEVYNGEIVAIRNGSEEKVSMGKMSTGQKICLALAFMFALYLSNGSAPNIIMLDEPVANLDDLHMLNLLDVLRRMSLSDTQIFFTTANPDVAKLFRRKFSFLEEDFAFFRIVESEQKVSITCEHYINDQEEPVKREKIV